MKDPKALSVETGAAEQPPQLSRRSLMTYAAAEAILTIAAGFGVKAATLLGGVTAPVVATTEVVASTTTTTTTAMLPPLALTPPDTVDYYDIGDAIVQTSLPTMPLVKLAVGLDGRVLLELPRLESGQGISTAAGIMVAEELDVPVDRVDVTLSDARPELVFNQLTGGSSSVRSLDAALPLLAATARARLVAAAAEQFGLVASSLTVVNGVVIAADGRTASYGSLTVAASLLAPPSNPQRKPKSQYKLRGVRPARLDALDIVTGAKKFTMDQNVPGAIPTMMRMPSQVRGTVVSVNNLGAVKGMPGVLEIVVIPPGGSISPRQVGVAVMAETFGQAWAAANMLDITWGDGPLNGQTNATIQASLRRSRRNLGGTSVARHHPASHCC